MWDSLKKSKLLVLHLRSRVPRTILYLVCSVGVLVGGLWAVVGTQVGWMPPTYAGEFVSFASFGAAWIVASWDFLLALGGGKPDVTST